MTKEKYIMQYTIIKNSWGLALLTLFIACNNQAPIEIGQNDPLEAPEAISVSQEQFELANMEWGQLEELEIPRTILTTGEVMVPPTDQVRVSAYHGGYVQSMALVPGQWVRKGQLLFRLENPEFVVMQQEYLETQEQLKFLEADFERQKTLLEEKVTSAKRYSKIESDYEQARVRQASLKKRLELLRLEPSKIAPGHLQTSIPVLAPIAGYVKDVQAVQGMFLEPTQVAVELWSDAHLQLQLKVFEKDVLQIQKGQKIQFTLPGEDPTVYSAQVDLVQKRVDQQDRMVQVLGTPEPTSKKQLLPGMYVEAKIITQVKKCQGLPATAIVSEGEKTFLLVGENAAGAQTLLRKQEVEVGVRHQEWVEILQPEKIASSQHILVKGGFNLLGME